MDGFVRLIVVFGFLFLILCNGVVLAANQHQLSLSTGVEYDSNPLLSAEDPTPVWRARLIPGYNLLSVNGNNELAVEALLRLEKSTDDDVSQPRQDPRLSVVWRRENPRDTFSLNALYDRTSTLTTEFEETGRITDDGSVGRAQLGGSWDHLLTERTSLNINANILNVTYIGVDLVDYDIQSAGVRLGYQFSELIEPYLIGSASHYTPANDEPSSNLYEFLVGSSYLYSENLGLNVQFGVAETTGPNSGSGYLGNVNIAYSGERSNLSVYAGRDVDPIARRPGASSLGGFRVNDRVRGQWDYLFNSRTTSSVSASWLRDDEITQRISRIFTASINRQLNYFWTFNIYATHRNQELDNIGQDKASANIIGFNFRWAEPDFKLTLPSNL
jgi:hypothetical protein